VVLRKAILDSDVWFLITDGLIQDELRDTFAQSLAECGVRGISCVTIIFGNPLSVGPGSCDISVGVSVFAVAPNCAFLFCNTVNGELRLFRTKGAFNSLLKGQPNPVFDESSTWNSLPLVTTLDLMSISIPPTQKLESTEVALSDSLVIDLDALFANRLSKEQVSSIFSSEDNMATVVMTSRTRNQHHLFGHWAEKQMITVDDPKTKPRDYENDKAKDLFVEVIVLLQKGLTPTDQLKQQLRKAYLENMKRFASGCQRDNEEFLQRMFRATCASEWSGMNPSKSLFLCRPQTFAGVKCRFPAPSSVPIESQPQVAEGEPAFKSWKDGVIMPRVLNLLYTPGYEVSTATFTRNCSICGSEDMTMALLFQIVCFSPSTSGCPPKRSRTRLQFPLAVGTFTEMGVLSSTLCCDPCSRLAVITSSSLDVQEVIFRAMPLVPYRANHEAINEALNDIFSQRFDEDDLPIVLVSVLLVARPRFEESNNVAMVDAINWLVPQLLRDILVTRRSLESASLPQRMIPLTTALWEDFANLNILNKDLITYPLTGFAVLLTAAGYHLTARLARRAICARRFLYLLVEEYGRSRGEIANSNAPVTARAMAVIFRRTLWLQQENEASSSNSLLSSDVGSSVLSIDDGAEPVLSVPIPCLFSAGLLSGQTYGVLQRTLEMRELETRFFGERLSKVVALFLHALVKATLEKPMASSWELFEGIMGIQAFSQAFSRAFLQLDEELGDDYVRSLYEEIITRGNF
jgi:hypothetical protein